MAKIAYIPKKFSKPHLRLIKIASEILEEYRQQGLVLTLRQLYYQFVSRDVIPNTQKDYKRLGGIIGDARLAGWLDWELIEDRARNLMGLEHYSSPQQALDQLASQYHIDLWANQQYRPEVWIEKEALSGVIAGVCNENDVPYFSCKGYTSLSEMWRTAERLKYYSKELGQTPYIIHFGDHDPSGIDMSRDIVDRIHGMFMSGCEFNRVALTMDQINEYKPPPNPAKITDPRYKTYIKAYGDESWELDALEPRKFRELIETELQSLIEPKQWKKDLKEKATVKQQLVELAADWSSIPERKQRLVSLEGEVVQQKSKLEEALREIASLRLAANEKKTTKKYLKGKGVKKKLK